MKRAAALVLLASCAGRCGAARGDHEGPHDDEPVPLENAESHDAATLDPARCRREDGSLPVSLVGNAVAGKSALWVSEISTGKLEILALPDGQRRVLKSGSVDTPAAITADGESYAYATLGALGKEQQLAVYRGASGDEPTFVAPRKPDESLAVDVVIHDGAPFAVWHEDGELVVRGATSRVVLPAPAGAALESPRLLSQGGQLLVLAVARVPDAADAGARSGPVSTWEGAAEPRSTSSLVGYAVGKGAVQLTAARGHLDAFEVAQRSDLVIFARDAAGSLLRVQWNGAGEPTRSTFRPTDVGPAPLSLVGDVLVYGNSDGDAIRVPLTPNLDDAGHASREPTMDDTRMIGTWPQRGTLLAGATELFWVRCTP